ncbi:ABC transporter ATP-binding protein/permease [Candidatus Babeliales bacterium]|nr:ABC transporter ATP-binding protein/permease [Candidatus Babeliales bacterium]
MNAYFLIDSFKQKLSLLKVRFESPWWQVIIDQKVYLGLALFGEIIAAIFRPMAILMIGWIFSIQRYDYFAYLFLVWVGVYLIQLVSRLFNSVLQLRCIHSVHYRAHQFFLQVDPIYHTRRSSGTILGKIDRASKGYEDLLDAVITEILQIAVGVVTVVISLSCYLWLLGLCAGLLLGIIMIVGAVTAKLMIIPYEKKLIRASDKSKSVGVENLAQNNLIRTCFASNEVDDRLRDKDKRLMHKEGKLWFMYNCIYAFIKILYVSSIFVIGTWLLWVAKSGQLEISMAISLLLMYLRGTHEIVKIEKPIRKILTYTTRINDLFVYIREFGKQTYPVLQKLERYCRVNMVLAPRELFSLQAKDIYFDYDATTKIFEGHTLLLEVSAKQINKLYGVIGPSGIGKSTLLSLLGGQLRPTFGKIFVDNVDIYQVDDIARRRLIALQGQVATNIRGTLKHNVLFGLPADIQIYSDDQLREVLEKVGLWALFEKKQGLATFVGEGGFTLSGGQRQRLNFANLYLRAMYFQPHLILIDEPTSSLDEMSERAITAMISQLATKAVTIVIAHRLKTLDDAVGLLDFSLLADEKELRFHPHEQLEKRSAYYRGLLAGHEPFDN